MITGLRILPWALLMLLAGCVLQARHVPNTRDDNTITPSVILRATAPTPTPTPAPPVMRHLPAAIDLTRPPRDAWERIRRGFAIPNLQGKLVDEWTNYYASKPQQIQLMSQRAGKFLYHVLEALEQRGLPTELALLPFVESAYNPMALSRAQASGLWQFMPATGRQYNLHQDWWRDQRRDPIASTDAALEYLSYLYEFQGDWHLALASYNWGEGAVRRSMARNAEAGKPTDYTAIRLPSETRNYIPKLQAIKNIVADPQKYGITLPHVPDMPYFVTVQKTRTLDLTVAAELAQMSEDEFKTLNPAYKRPVILGEHQPTLLLPADRVALFQANLQTHQGRLSDWNTYKTKQGESYAAIAKRHGITREQLLRINGLDLDRTRAVAQTLLVPAPGARPALDHPAWRESPTVRTHVVKPGDTLYDIARHYGTTVRTLQQLNQLRGSRLSLGKRLRVPVRTGRG